MPARRPGGSRRGSTGFSNGFGSGSRPRGGPPPRGGNASSSPPPRGGNAASRPPGGGPGGGPGEGGGGVGMRCCSWRRRSLNSARALAVAARFAAKGSGLLAMAEATACCRSEGAAATRPGGGANFCWNSASAWTRRSASARSRAPRSALFWASSSMYESRCCSRAAAVAPESATCVVCWSTLARRSAARCARRSALVCGILHSN